MRAFLGEHRPDAAVAIFWTRPQRRFFQAPRRCLGVELTDILERASGKKSVAYKTYCPFHAAFFVTARNRHRARLEPIIGGQLQQRRVEADRLGTAFQYCTFEVVIEDYPRDRIPCGERLDVAAQEIVHGAVQVKSQEQMPLSLIHISE